MNRGCFWIENRTPRLLSKHQQCQVAFHSYDRGHKYRLGQCAFRFWDLQIAIVGFSFTDSLILLWASLQVNRHTGRAPGVTHDPAATITFGRDKRTMSLIGFPSLSSSGIPIFAKARPCLLPDQEDVARHRKCDGVAQPVMKLALIAATPWRYYARLL